MTAALEGGEWSAARPDPHFTPGKDPVPIVQEAGWAPGLVWTGGKSRPTGIFFKCVYSFISGYNVVTFNRLMIDLSSLIDFEVIVLCEFRKESVSSCPISYCPGIICRWLCGGCVTSCLVNVGFLGL
jgi:hypothetical protein